VSEKREEAKARTVKRLVREVWAKVETGEILIVAPEAKEGAEQQQRALCAARLRREFQRRELRRRFPGA